MSSDKGDNFNVSERYRNIVLTASENSSDIIIENSTLEHAKFLSYNLIKNAKETIRIFTGSLNELFYKDDRIKQIINDAINRGVKFEIVTEQKLPQSGFFNKESIKFKPFDKKSNIKNHFLISDNRGFRFEEEHDTIIKKPYYIKGKASFNSPEICNTLIDVFKSISKTGS